MIPTSNEKYLASCTSLLVTRCAKPCFLGFPRKKKPLHNGSCEACRVLFYFLCMFVSVKIVIGRLGRPRSTHTAPTPAPMGSVHAQIITKPSRAGLAVSRSELVEPGAATRVFRGMARPCFCKKLKNVSCEYDRLNGWNSTLQAAWYIRHVRWTCLFYTRYFTYNMVFVN